MVGVILNLAVWFGSQVLFADLVQVNYLGASFDVPVLWSGNTAALALVAACAVAVFHFRFGMVAVLLASSLAGVVYAIAISAT